MKRARFRDPAGSVRTGTWNGDAVVFADREYDLSDVQLLPPTDPSKIVCVGRNYALHAEETDSDVPDRPLLFLKAPNTLAAHGDTISLPPDKERIEHEAELGVVIGEQCRRVAAEDAADVIAGYTCVNDLSNRDDQRQEKNWVRGKSFDNSAPVGPVVATPDELPEDASVVTEVNGERRQHGSIEDMIFPVDELIAEITELVTLEPGDIVATGTPEGVAPLEDGDTVDVTVEGVGTLRNEIRID